MARYREVGRSPKKFIAVDFAAQILPDTFEHAVDVLVDGDLDLSAFRNDTTGAPAYRPRVLLKLVLLGYSRGLVSSRAIKAACRQNIVFKALTGDG